MSGHRTGKVVAFSKDVFKGTDRLGDGSKVLQNLDLLHDTFCLPASDKK